MKSTCSSEITKTTSTITIADRIDHFLARWGYNRTGHRVEPGLYQIGEPNQNSPVFASANYTLSFDALRSHLKGVDAYILVLDTKGINVWCAAGKGTFGTDELVRQITKTNLAGCVKHRTVIVPQLGAAGISAHEVAKRSGFFVQYGPIRASDLPRYLNTGTATPDMRRVTFPLWDRIILIPIELVHIAIPTVIIAILLWICAGHVTALAAIAAVLAGTVLFPILLPYIPTQDFSMKGLILGTLVALPFSAAYATASDLSGWAAGIGSLVPLLIIPAVVAYLALNFTGSTPFTSRTGVKKEIFRYIPLLAIMTTIGVVLGISLGISQCIGVI